MPTDPLLASRLLDQESRYGAHSGIQPGLVCARADGAWIWDLQGNRYLDFLTGTHQGHNHTRIAAAMVEQCLRLCLPAPGLGNDRRPALLEKLCARTGFDRALLLTRGSEAVETAIAAIRGWAGQARRIPPDRAEILVFTGSSHGHTLALLGLGGDPDRDGAGPVAPGFRRVPYGDLAAAQAAVGPATCGILVEPVQGDAGVVVPPRGFLRGLRDLCDSRRLMLVVDEVQSGLGRTGKLLACEHEAMRPDGAVLGRSLGGGFYPVSAFLASRDLLPTPGLQAGTFGGNPLAAAVAGAALDVLEDEKLVDRSAELGAYLLERLRDLDSGRVRTVRGLGLWAGLELRPEAGGARRLCALLREAGLLCQAVREHTLRLVPPLVVTREQLDWALGRLRAALEK